MTANDDFAEEDKLIFEDDFREILVQKNMKLMKSHQAELFTITGNKELKEAIIEMKQKQIVDEILGIVSLDELEELEENPKEKIDGREYENETSKQRILLNSELINKDRDKFDFYSNNTSHFKQESLYKDHNITMILKMSHTEDEQEEEEKQEEQLKEKDDYSDHNINNKNFNEIKKNKVNYDIIGNRNNFSNENYFFSNNKKIEDNSLNLLNNKRVNSDFKTEYNSNYLNQEIKNELNNRNNLVLNKNPFSNNNLIENTNIENGN